MNTVSSPAGAWTLGLSKTSKPQAACLGTSPWFSFLHHLPPPHSAATLEKPVLSLHPPWTTIFKGERVTLRCDGHYPLLLELRPVSTLWYLGHLLLPSHKKSIEVQTPGVYRCQTRGAPVSDPIHLSVSNGEWSEQAGRGSERPLMILGLLWGRTVDHFQGAGARAILRPILSLWSRQRAA